MAKAWLKKEEDKLEINPELLSTDRVSAAMTLGAVIKKYKDEVTDYGRSKAFTLEQIQLFDISKIKITELKRSDYGNHAQRRAAGYTNEHYQLKPVKPATINFDLQCIKSVLDYAELVWGLEVNTVEYEKAVKGLRKARIVGDSDERMRLITSKELMCGYLNDKPEQYIQFVDDHIKVHSPNKIILDAPKVEATGILSVAGNINAESDLSCLCGSEPSLGE